MIYLFDLKFEIIIIIIYYIIPCLKTDSSIIVIGFEITNMTTKNIIIVSLYCIVQ